MFFTRLISGIILVLAAIFFFVQGGYFLLLRSLFYRFLVYMNCCVYFRWKIFSGSGDVCGDCGSYGMLCIYGWNDWLFVGTAHI